MIRVTVDIDEDERAVHRLAVEIYGDPNVESCIEELRVKLVDWATTWLKYPGYKIMLTSDSA